MPKKSNISSSNNANKHSAMDRQSSVQSTSAEYDVGYKKPPKSTQFQPGRSGNKKGRPKGIKNFQSILQHELDVTIPIVENGQRRHFSKKEVFLKTLVNNAIKGDPRASAMLLSQIRDSEEAATIVQEARSTTLSLNEHQVLESFMARIKNYKITDATSISEKTKGDDK